MTVKVKDKVIDVSKIASMLVQDSHDVDEFIFDIDESLAGLNVFMLYTNRTGKGYIDLLEETEGKYLWKPSHRATVEEGTTYIQIIALEFGDSEVVKRWSSVSATLDIQRNIEADELITEPTQSMIEDEICGELE